MRTFLFSAGWLLVAYQGSPIGWYEQLEHCKEAGTYYDKFSLTRCVPDRFEFDEGGSLYKVPKVE